MASNYRVSYSVDMVFVIDATGSMEPILDLVKKNALSFYDDVTAVMSKKSKVIDQLRIRVIAYRDYLADGNDAMLTTDFFTLPQDREDFKECVESIVAQGGGDEPEDGYEALAYAIRSHWSTEGKKRRQVIVLWTDASTHELGFGKSSPIYPHSMASSMAELSEWWGDGSTDGFVDHSAKRLILYAPDCDSWNAISDNWDNVIHYPSEAGNGLENIEYQEILNTIANSI